MRLFISSATQNLLISGGKELIRDKLIGRVERTISDWFRDICINNNNCYKNRRIDHAITVCRSLTKVEVTSKMFKLIFLLALVAFATGKFFNKYFCENACCIWWKISLSTCPKLIACFCIFSIIDTVYFIWWRFVRLLCLLTRSFVGGRTRSTVNLEMTEK